jgi:asparagine synthase (glutamine-hydrolysing)
VNRYSILAADFARRFGDLEPDDPDLPVTEREFHERKLKNSVLFETIGWLDACAAGRGVELGLPFCDVRLVELCLSFPPEQKLRRGWTRYAMRRAMDGILPPAIQWRETKTELHAGWAHAVLTTEEGRIAGVLSNPNPAVRRYLDPGAVRELYERWRAGGMPADEERALWRAVSLALWLSPGT